ncbi:hypothetical protein [Anaeromusa sp.]|uniref:hypothetical protein n=1 Tax=Anaeromusa sp. TaxID=1872520 RepID=UPI00260E09A7|nr:hypothetical protein [Anaeromusa sp.]MDD3157025.1 hypothetical protein [Anaeromusa sp.]
MANWSVQNTITTSTNRVKDGIVKLYAEVQLLYGKLNAMRTLRNTGTAPSDAIAKEVWVDDVVLKRRDDTNKGWVLLQAKPIDGSTIDGGTIV